MSVAYNTGATALADGVTHTVQPTITIPATVIDNDFLVVAVNIFTWSANTGITISLTPGVGSWTQIGGQQTSGADSSLQDYGAVFIRQATSADASTTLTFSVAGTFPTDQIWWTIALEAYHGLDATHYSVLGNGGVNTASTSVPAPVVTTDVAGEWGIYIGPICPDGSGSVSSAPGGATIRHDASTSGTHCVIADTDASVGGAGTTVGGGNWTTTNTHDWWNAFTLAVAPLGAAAPPGTGALTGKKVALAGKGILEETFSASFNSTDINGIDTYDVTASGNSSVAGSHPLRVLHPTSPSDAYPHSFLYLFPVVPDQDTTYGDPIQIAHDAGWHNTYNVTLIQPGYAIDPWYADNGTDATILQERFTLDVVDWVTANFATSGQEKNYLMGFSKSGTGGAQLIFRNPDVFDVVALWDFPADTSTYNRFDPSETAVMGSASNFSTYELSSSNITSWISGQDYTTRNRIWIGGNSLYGTEVDDFNTLLTSLGVLHTYTYNVSETHAWNVDWMAAAIADIIPDGNGALSANKPVVNGSGSLEFSLFDQPSTPGTLQSDPTSYTLGMQFSSSVDGTLDGIWFYSATGAAELPDTIALYAVTGPTLVTSEAASWSGAAGSGWVRANFASPPSITSGTQYKACVLNASAISNWYSSTSHDWDTGAHGSGVTNGDLTAPNNAGADGGQDTFNASSTLAYPSSSFNASNYWIDVSFLPSGAISGTGSITVSKPVLDGSGSVPVTITGSGGILIGHRNTILDESDTPILDESSAAIADESTSRIVSVSGSGTAGAAAFTGTGDIQGKKVTASGVGSLEFAGSGNSEITYAGVSGTGVETFTGSGAVTVSKVTVFGSGTPTEFGTGNLAVPKSELSGTGSESFTGSGSPAVSKPTVSGTGIAPLSVSGTGNIQANEPSGAGTGIEEFSGSGEISAHKAATSAVGSFGSKFGSGGLTLKIPVAGGDGAESYVASGGQTLNKSIAIGTGTLEISGSGTVQANKPQIIGISQVFGTSRGSGQASASSKLTGATTSSSKVSGRA